MKRYLWSFAVTAGLAAAAAAPAPAQEVHEISMVSSGKDEFRFQPASLTVRRGDVLLGPWGMPTVARPAGTP